MDWHLSCCPVNRQCSWKETIIRKLINTLEICPAAIMHRKWCKFKLSLLEPYRVTFTIQFWIKPFYKVEKLLIHLVLIHRAIIFKKEEGNNCHKSFQNLCQLYFVTKHSQFISDSNLKINWTNFVNFSDKMLMYSRILLKICELQYKK